MEPQPHLGNITAVKVPCKKKERKEKKQRVYPTSEPFVLADCSVTVKSRTITEVQFESTLYYSDRAQHQKYIHLILIWHRHTPISLPPNPHPYPPQGDNMCCHTSNPALEQPDEGLKALETDLHFSAIKNKPCLRFYF